MNTGRTNSAGCSSPGMPGPGVAHLHRTPAFSARSCTTISPPWGVWRIALSSRLVSTRSIMPRSAVTTGRPGRDVGHQALVARLGRQLELLEHVLHQVGQREAFLLGLDHAVFEPRQLEQLLRQPADLAALAQRDLQVAPALGLVERAGLEQQRLQVAVQRGERRAQVVRDVGEQLAALLVLRVSSRHCSAMRCVIGVKAWPSCAISSPPCREPRQRGRFAFSEAMPSVSKRAPPRSARAAAA
jgi:hypothetical protein